MEDNDYLTIKELANLLGKNRKTVERWIKLDKLPHSKKGRTYCIPIDKLFDANDVIDFLKALKLPYSDENDNWTIAEYSYFWRIHRTTVERRIKKGEIPARTVRRRYHIPGNYPFPGARKIFLASKNREYRRR